MHLKGLSLFSSAGIGEYYLSEVGVDIVCANELLKKRCDLYRSIYPSCHVVEGDINTASVFQEILQFCHGVDFVLASPPCQGMSIANKFKPEGTIDPRNLLILKAMDVVDIIQPKYVLIENVPALLKVLLPYEDGLKSVEDILRLRFGDKYEISTKIVDAADYGVPQTRLRAIVKMNKKGLSWEWPKIEKRKKTVHDAIGYLPPLEPGEKSDIKWHFARKHTALQVEAMRHTPTGHSAYENPVFYPKTEDGKRVKGFNTTYRRMEWDKPCPTITMRNDAISSQRNVHPGRLLDNGLYSDPRVLTPLELMLCDSLPEDWRIPDDTPELLIRQIIGESIPPLLIKKIVEGIKK